MALIDSLIGTAGQWVSSSDPKATLLQPLEWLKKTGGGNTGKASTWEGGHREVGVFRWLGHITAGVSDVLGSTLDIVPTMTALAGAGDLSV